MNARAGPNTFKVKAVPTFLVVDDDADNRYLTRHSLTREFRACQVIDAATVEEALKKACENLPDVVLTDHHLGNTDGIKFITRLRALGVSCPVVMLTGNVDPLVHERARAAGANGVFLSFETDYLKYLREVLS